MDHVLKTIEDAKEKIRQHDEERFRLMRFVNQCCVFANIPAIYPDAEMQSDTGATMGVKRNSFFGRPLSTCVRDYMEMRQRASHGPSPASLDEIFEALKAGGYELSASGSNADDQKRGVAISLGKNSPAFIRLPTGDWGLVEWYPNVREKKRKTAENGDKAATDSQLMEGSAADPKPPSDSELMSIPSPLEDQKLLTTGDVRVVQNKAVAMV